MDKIAVTFRFVGGPLEGQLRTGWTQGELNETHRLTIREKDGTKIRDAIYMYKVIEEQPTWWFDTYTEWRESETDAPRIHSRKRSKSKANKS